MTGLTNSQRLQYSLATSTFLRIKAYNQAILDKRTDRNGLQYILVNPVPTYYVFVDNAEEAMYKLGLFILTQNDPVGVENHLYDIPPQI